MRVVGYRPFANAGRFPAVLWEYAVSSAGNYSNTGSQASLPSSGSHTDAVDLACGQPLESGLHTEVPLQYVRLTEEVSI
jgi:hypothetical protein